MRPRTATLGLLGTIAFAALTLLACMVGDLATTGQPRWACPSVTPRPYDKAGPVKREYACNCTTDPATGAESCDTCRDYYVEYEQEYGLGADGAPPAPRPTVFGMTGTSYVFGQRVEAPPLHLIVNARSGPRLTRSDVPSDTQVYLVDLTWRNVSGSPIPIDYGDRLRLRAITQPDGAVRSDGSWGTNALAREATGMAPPPQAIPVGESSLTVPIVAPAGEPKTVSLRFLAMPGGSGGLWSVVGAPSLSPAQIDALLARNQSPATGSGQLWYEIGLRYGIDPVYALAFYKKESSMGRDRVHNLPGGGNSHNVGNIICTAGWPSGCVCTSTHCFRKYASWAEGIEDWFRLLRTRYVDQGLDTIDEILPVYAPSFENDTQLYIQQVKDRVIQWRGGASGGDLRDTSLTDVEITWSEGELQRGSCPFGPGTLTDWDSGKPGPIAVAAPPGAARVVQIALNQVGKPYIWGAKGPEAFDCSGLATWSYAQIGITIPQGTAGQWPQLQSVAQNALQPGDLVYMNTDTPATRRVTHVGMLVGDLNGNGQWDLVHAASPTLGVRVDYDIFDSAYYAQRILGFRTAR